MKTVAYWLSALPNGDNVKALANADREMLSEIVKSQRVALFSAFVWDKSAEGHDYWERVADGLPEDEFDNP